VASEYQRVFPERYTTVHEALPSLITATLVAIRENNARYPDFLPAVRNAVYDSYLKSQGVHEGLQSYHRVVALTWAYEQTHKNGSPVDEEIKDPE
jgi:hypothetical protein